MSSFAPFESQHVQDGHLNANYRQSLRLESRAHQTGQSTISVQLLQSWAPIAVSHKYSELSEAREKFNCDRSWHLLQGPLSIVLYSLWMICNPCTCRPRKEPRSVVHSLHPRVASLIATVSRNNRPYMKPRADSGRLFCGAIATLTPAYIAPSLMSTAGSKWIELTLDLKNGSHYLQIASPVISQCYN